MKKMGNLMAKKMFKREVIREIKMLMERVEIII